MESVEPSTGVSGTDSDPRRAVSFVVEADADDDASVEEYGQPELPLAAHESDQDEMESAVESASKVARVNESDDAPSVRLQVTEARGELPRKKKTRGRVKIEMEFIQNKLRRYTTFSKRKSGIMKKAYELSTLTGTQVLLLVASETGHVYTFATPKLQPMITSESGKALIQTCLNSPDVLSHQADIEQRMSSTGFEEPELSYTVQDEEGRDQIVQNLPEQGLPHSDSQSAPMTRLLFTETGHPLSSSVTDRDSHRSQGVTEAAPIVSASLPLTIQPSLAIPGFNIIPGSGKGGTAVPSVVPQFPGIPSTLGFPNVINSQALLAQLQSSAQAMQAAMMQQQRQHEQRLQAQQETGQKDVPERNSSECDQTIRQEPPVSHVVSRNNSDHTQESHGKPPLMNLTSVNSSIRPPIIHPMLQPVSTGVMPTSQLLTVPMSMDSAVVSPSGMSPSSPSATCIVPREHPPPLTLELSSQIGGIPQYQLLQQQVMTNSSSSDSHVGSIIFSPAGAAGGGLALGRMSLLPNREISASPNHNTSQSVTSTRKSSF